MAKKRYPHPYDWNKVKKAGTYIKGVSGFSDDLFSDIEEDIHPGYKHPESVKSKMNKTIKPKMFELDNERIRCEKCGAFVVLSSKSNYVFCQNGHIVHKPKLQIKPKNLGSLLLGRIIYKVSIEKISKRNEEIGEIDCDGYHIYVNNSRKGEIVDVEVKKVIPEKGVAFADVIHYRKTVGKLDFNREFNCPKEVNAVSHGGGNRNKCISVIYPEERKIKSQY